MSPVKKIMSSKGLKARVMRSSVWSIFGYGGSQVLRLASNLILTRLLFPEAFGLMALVTVFMVGLGLFSDIGIGPSIQQNKRGDDPDFLDTAWTIQVIRGFLLWLGTCALALPVAQFYNEPMLAQLLPVAGFSLVADGFKPTRVHTANRHLQIGRLTVLELIAQVIGILAVVLVAWIYQSIWALVLGMIVTRFSKLTLAYFFLDGHYNRFQLERESAMELIHFGKWIFLSTICAFLGTQGDRLILGKMLTIGQLGIYSVGFFMASFPTLLGSSVFGKILIPLYREKPPAASPENYRHLQKMRFLMTGGVMFLLLFLAWAGPTLVSFLYDARYHAAGGIVVLLCVASIIEVLGMTYPKAALAAGDSRSFFLLMIVQAIVGTTFFLVGVIYGGLIGGLTGRFLYFLVVYPVVVWLARKHHVWDPLHDGIYAVLGLSVGAAALWYNLDAVIALDVFG